MNSWEPEENLVNAKDILLDFQRAKKLLPLSPVSLPEKTDKCALAKPERGKRKASYGKNRIDSESEGEPLDIQGVSSDALSSSAESDGLESSVSDDDIQIDLKRSRIFLSEQESKFLKGMTEFQKMLDSIPGAMLKVANSVSHEPPPQNFVYISSFIYGNGVPKPDPAFLIGCDCTDLYCTSKTCHCVHQSQDITRHVGNYTADGRLRLIVEGKNYTGNTFIYECNVQCSCAKSDKCQNRVIQKGRTVPLEIFHMGDDRGWAVRAVTLIPAGTFIDLYYGEIITDEEADERFRKTYRGDGRSLYLFDLDFSAETGNKADFTIDAYNFGSVSRFFNHSCNPNLQIIPCFIDHIDQSLHFIAFFAARDIKPDEELCFDYTNERGRANGSTTHSGPVKYDSGIIKCLCGDKNCRKFVYPSASK